MFRTLPRALPPLRSRTNFRGDGLTTLLDAALKSPSEREHVAVDRCLGDGVKLIAPVLRKLGGGHGEAVRDALLQERPERLLIKNAVFSQFLSPKHVI